MSKAKKIAFARERIPPGAVVRHPNCPRGCGEMIALTDGFYCPDPACRWHITFRNAARQQQTRRRR